MTIVVTHVTLTLTLNLNVTLTRSHSFELYKSSRSSSFVEDSLHLCA